MEGIAFVADVGDVFVVGLRVCICFFFDLDLPLLMCFSQYLEFGQASFEHLHFFPSEFGNEGEFRWWV